MTARIFERARRYVLCVVELPHGAPDPIAGEYVYGSGATPRAATEQDLRAAGLVAVEAVESLVLPSDPLRGQLVASLAAIKGGAR